MHGLPQNPTWYLLFRTDMARKYRLTLDELELKQVEHNRMVSDFETKLRQKEVRFFLAPFRQVRVHGWIRYDVDAIFFQQEQFELKKQLAEFAIKLNMEASKGREFVAKSHE